MQCFSLIILLLTYITSTLNSLTYNSVLISCKRDV